MKSFLKANFTKGQLAVICIAILMLICGFAVNMFLSIDTSGMELNYTIPLAIFVLGAVLRDKLTFLYELFEGNLSTLLISSFAVVVLGAILCLDGTDCLTPLLLIPLGCVAMRNKEREGCAIVFTLALFGAILLFSLMSLELSKKLYAYMFLLSPIPILLQAVISSKYKYEKGVKYTGRQAISFAAECSLCLFIIGFLLYSATMTRKSTMFNIISSFLWIPPALPKTFSDFLPLCMNTPIQRRLINPSLTFLESTGMAFGYIPCLLVLMLMLAFLVAGLCLRREKQRGIWQDLTVCMLLSIFLPMLSSILYEGEILLPFFSNNLLLNTVNAVVLVLAAFAPEENSPMLALEREHPDLAGCMVKDGSVSESSICFYYGDIAKRTDEIVSYFPEEYEKEIICGLENARIAELSYAFGDAAAVTRHLLRKSLSKQLVEGYVIRGDDTFQKLKAEFFPEFIEHMSPHYAKTVLKESEKTDDFDKPHKRSKFMNAVDDFLLKNVDLKSIKEEVFILSIYRETDIAEDEEEE